MLVPSTPVLVAVFALLAILSALDWYIGGLALNRKATRSRAEDSPRQGQARSFRKAA